MKKILSVIMSIAMMFSITAGLDVCAYASETPTCSLSFTSCTYTGKVRCPSVTVKNSSGKTLKKGTDYTVSKQSGRKNVGKYYIKIKFKGNYSSCKTKTLYFKIKPKKTSISKLSKGNKKITVKWKKKTSQVTGYQIQYSTNKSFSNAKTVTIKSNKTTSKTIKSLKKGTKYYVRVRTYKTVKINGKSTRLHSAWSKTKSVTTKGTAATCTTDDNHSLSVGNMGRWFSSRSELESYVKNVMQSYADKYHNNEITWDEYGKLCPYGYECWNCSYCGKWTGNFKYH